MSTADAHDPRVAAIVLAGGASRRFGADKLAAMRDGRPLLHHALGRVVEVADPVVLVLAPGAPEPPLPAGLADRVVVARDPVAFGGPLAGLAAGLAVLDEAVEVALVAGGDMPTLAPAVLRLMVDAVAAADGRAAAILDADPPSPLPLAIRPAPAFDAARALLAADRRSLMGLLDVLGATRIEAARWRALDPGGETLADVDTRADL